MFQTSLDRRMSNIIGDLAKLQKQTKATSKPNDVPWISLYDDVVFKNFKEITMLKNIDTIIAHLA